MYIEDFLALNAAVNLLALLLTMRVLSLRRVWWRLALAAWAGAVWAALAEMVGFGWWLQPVPPCFMVWIAFPVLWGKGAWKRWLRAVGVLYAVAFLMGGAVVAAANWVSAWRQEGGSWALRASVWVVVGGCLLGAGVGVLVHWWRATRPRGICAVRFTLGERESSAQAMVDTGNVLCEPISGLPVAVMALEDAAFLPMKWREALHALAADAPVTLPEGFPGVRWVPFGSVGGSGTLVALAAELLPGRVPFMLAFGLEPMAYMLLPEGLGMAIERVSRERGQGE